LTRHNQHKTSYKNPFKKWYRYKYSGFITVPVVLVLVLVAMYYYESQQEFFDSWNCDLLIDYKGNEMTTVGFPTYLEMTNEQKKYYDSLIENDCSFKP